MGWSRSMTPKTDAAVSGASYAGAGLSIFAGLTLTEWGVIAGIITAVLTLAVNWIYQYRKDRREQKLWKIQMDKLAGRSESGRARVAAIIAAGGLALAVPVVVLFEGLVTTTYSDPVGIPTICYGHTATATPGRTATQDECQGLLDQDMQIALAGISECVNSELKPNEWAALVSFSYNVGTGAACGSTMVRMINAGHPPTNWCPQLQRWVYAGGRKLKGLERRREAELALCLGNA